MLWFTSDQHFGHANVIKYCDRPFETVDEMDNVLIGRHNASVSPTDAVIHLGDFSLHPRHLEKLKRMNGTHSLIMGNHDACHPVAAKRLQRIAHMKQRYQDAGFEVVDLERELNLGSYRVLLCHLPYFGDHDGEVDRFNEYRPIDRGQWLLHGHVHKAWKVRNRMINVSVDQWDFAPVSIDTIDRMIREQESVMRGRSIEILPF